jgi:hypothetical protein
LDVLRRVELPHDVIALKLDWDGIYWLSQLLLVLSAGIALVSGRIVNNRQTKQTLELQARLSEADAKASQAKESAAKTESESSHLRIVVAQAEEKPGSCRERITQTTESLCLTKPVRGTADKVRAACS